MTGLHMGHAHFLNNKGILEPGDTTVAELLRSAGYTTLGVGKWAMGVPGTTGLPHEQGFDHWFGYLSAMHAHNYYPQFLWRSEKMEWIMSNWECQKEVYSHDLLTEEALGLIQNIQDFPFFLYLPYTIPHANNELYDLTGNGMQVPSDEPYSDQDWP